MSYARRFFVGEADVQRALERLSAVLDAHDIPYAIVGAMALNEWGYRRVTVDVAVLLSADGLRRLKEAVLGHGYLEKFPGSRGLRDTENGVNVDVVLAGDSDWAACHGPRRVKPGRFYQAPPTTTLFRVAPCVNSAASTSSG